MNKKFQAAKTTYHQQKNRIYQVHGGSGRKVQNVELEHELNQYFASERKEERRMIIKDLMELALQPPLSKPGLKASPCWCDNFYKRYEITTRASTHQGQKLPKDHEQRVVKLFTHLRVLHAKKHYRLSNIIAVDQTPVFFYCVSSKTLEK